jgi:hypothetical protein
MEMAEVWFIFQRQPTNHVALGLFLNSKPTAIFFVPSLSVRIAPPSITQ